MNRHFRAKSIVFKTPSEHTINNNNCGIVIINYFQKLF